MANAGISYCAGPNKDVWYSRVVDRIKRREIQVDKSREEREREERSRKIYDTSVSGLFVGIFVLQAPVKLPVYWPVEGRTKCGNQTQRNCVRAVFGFRHATTILAWPLSVLPPSVQSEASVPLVVIVELYLACNRTDRMQQD